MLYSLNFEGRYCAVRIKDTIWSGGIGVIKAYVLGM